MRAQQTIRKELTGLYLFQIPQSMIKKEKITKKTNSPEAPRVEEALDQQLLHQQKTRTC